MQGTINLKRNSLSYKWLAGYNVVEVFQTLLQLNAIHWLIYQN